MKKLIFIIVALMLIVIGVPIMIVLFFDTDTIEQPEIESQYKIKVMINATKEIQEIDLEEYLKGVVASEMPGEFELEALKAQAVAARTYAMARTKTFNENGHPDHKGAPLCDTTHCQVYKSKEAIRNIKSEYWMDTYWKKISQAVHDTRSMVMTYDNKLVDQPLFHSTSGGRTENSEDVFVSAVPYLRSVNSPYESESPHLKDTVSLTKEEFKRKISNKYKNLVLNVDKAMDEIKIIERSDGDRIVKVRIGNLVLSGRDVRETLNLKSANFTVTTSGNNIVFTTVGYGHGVGMSQYGAYGMAKEGYSYDEILKYYYQNVEIQSLDMIQL